MLISVVVKAGSKKGPLIERQDETNFVVFVQQPAVDDKANEAVIKLLAEYFKIAKSRVILTKGQKSRQKLFEINL